MTRYKYKGHSLTFYDNGNIVISYSGLIQDTKYLDPADVANRDLIKSRFFNKSDETDTFGIRELDYILGK